MVLRVLHVSDIHCAEHMLKPLLGEEEYDVVVVSGDIECSSTAGLLVVLKGLPREPVEAALWVIAILLIVGGTIGGHVGGVHMDEEKSRELLEAVVVARIDPDQAEHVEAWRARTAHEHAMVALVLATTLLQYTGFSAAVWGRGCLQCTRVLQR